MKGQIRSSEARVVCLSNISINSIVHLYYTLVPKIRSSHARFDPVSFGNNAFIFNTLDLYIMRESRFSSLRSQLKFWNTH